MVQALQCNRNGSCYSMYLFTIDFSSVLFVVMHFCLFRILHFHGQWSPEGHQGRAEWCSPTERPSGLKSATWLRPLHRGHGHLVKLARHALAGFQIWKGITSIWMGPLSMEVLWLEGYQRERRKFKGQLCWSFICNSQKQSNWRGLFFSEIKLHYKWINPQIWGNCSGDGSKIRTLRSHFIYNN